MAPDSNKISSKGEQFSMGFMLYYMLYGLPAGLLYTFTSMPSNMPVSFEALRTRAVIGLVLAILGFGLGGWQGSVVRKGDYARRGVSVVTAWVGYLLLIGVFGKLGFDHGLGTFALATAAMLLAATVVTWHVRPLIIMGPPIGAEVKSICAYG